MATSTTMTNTDLNQSQGQLLQCPLCQNNYDRSTHQAKLLACHHSFCFSCLMKLVSKELKAIKCPTCHKRTDLSENGIDGLQNNFYVSQVRDMMLSIPPTQDIMSNNSKKQLSRDICKKHRNQPLLFFCDTCMVSICMNCTVLDHDKNGGHIIRDISAVVGVHKELLQAKVAKAEYAIQMRQTLLTQLKTEMGNLDTTKDISKERLQETFIQLKSRLEQRQKELLSKIEEYFEVRKNDIIEKAQTVKIDLKKLNELMQNYQDIIDEGKPLSIIDAATDGDSIKSVDEISQQLKLSQPSNGFIEYDYNAGLQDFVDSVGKLGSIKCNRALPSVVEVQECVVIASNIATFNLTLCSVVNQPLDGYPISANITDPCKDTIPNKVHSIGNGLYTVRFCPQMPGVHTLDIQFMGKTIYGTEQTFTVHSNNPIMRIGEKGSETGQMIHPTSIALAPNGNIYVADMGNKRIQVFTKRGKFVNQFKVGASKSTTYDIAINQATEEMICTKVAPSAMGNMVADSVRFFGLGGEKLRQFTCKGMTNGLFIAVNSKGRIIVTDATANCIFLYSKDGTLLKKFGGQGNKPGQFYFPAAICVGKDDMIFVSDTKNHRVQVFSHDTTFMHQFGCQGNKKGQFYLPRGIAADLHGNVLVADSHNKIQVFHYDGTFISCIDSKGDPISDPYNMAVTNDGKVFIADFKNNCIKKYSYR